MNIGQIASWAVEFAIETAFLTVALWILVKLQKFQYHFPGLLASAAVASAFDMIPFVGHYLAIVALYLCMVKVTREDIGGLVFTVGVSYALTFGMNLFLLGALMGDLRISARANDAAVPGIEATEPDDDNLDGTNSPGALVQPAAPTNAVVKPKPQGQKPQGLVLKGIIKGPKSSTVMLSMGSRTYNLFAGDSVQIQTTNGPEEVTLERIEGNSVILNIGGKEVQVCR